MNPASKKDWYAGQYIKRNFGFHGAKTWQLPLLCNGIGHDIIVCYVNIMNSFIASYKGTPYCECNMIALLTAVFGGAEVE
jgi:hypothetical protein